MREGIRYQCFDPIIWNTKAHFPTACNFQLSVRGETKQVEAVSGFSDVSIMIIIIKNKK